MNKPLKGIKVVDFTLFVAGPSTTKMLADWGADIIKIESFSGDPFRLTGLGQGAPCDEDFNPCFNYLNSNKRGISINLKNKEGMKIMHRLLADAEVFVTNFRPGALKRLGLDYETLSEKYPKLVWAEINGYGNYGPDKDNPGFDTIAFWARSGAMIDQVEKNTAPIIPLIGFGDCTAGSNLAAGITAALFDKTRTGKGQKVSVSLLGSAAWNIGTTFISQQFGIEFPKSRKSPAMPFINSYKCKNNEWVFISVLEHERYYNQMCKLFGREDLVDNSKYCTTKEASKRSKELVEIFDNEISKFTYDEVSSKLRSVDIAHEKIRHAIDMINDPQCIENKYISEITHENGKKTYAPMTPVKFGNVDPNQMFGAPTVGEHTKEILEEYGYTEDQIAKVYKNKVVI